MLNQCKNERNSAANEYNIEINIQGTVNGNVAGINNGIMDSLISENSNGTTKHLSYLNIKDDNKEFYKFMTEELDAPKDGSLPYEHLIMYFKDAPESLQIALLQNICNICSQIDIIESYEVLEDFLATQFPVQLKRLQMKEDSLIFEVVFQLGYRRKLRIYFSSNDTKAIDLLKKANLIEVE